MALQHGRFGGSVLLPECGAFEFDLIWRPVTMIRKTDIYEVYNVIVCSRNLRLSSLNGQANIIGIWQGRIEQGRADSPGNDFAISGIQQWGLTNL